MAEPVFAMIVPLSSGGGHPDHSLPPGMPARPDQGLPPGMPARPDHTLPDAGAPPLPPQINPVPPPLFPGVPIYPLPPNGTLPEEPPQVYPPLPPSAGTGRLLVLCWIVGVGYRWVVIDGAAEAAPK